jgi:hypothetical protein
MVTPKMFDFPTKPSEPLRLFLEDIIIRNWGDPTIVNSDATVWWSSIGERPFQLRFMGAMVTPLEAPRREPMILAKYLVEE